MSAPTYDDARARIAADLAADERAYPGRSFMLIYRDDLRTLLAGPPEPSACPACYRGEVFGLSTDGGFWVEMGSSAGGANPHGMNGWIELIEHHPDGRNVRREYIATDSPLASCPEPSVEEVEDAIERNVEPSWDGDSVGGIIAAAQAVQALYRSKTND